MIEFSNCMPHPLNPPCDGEETFRCEVCLEERHEYDPHCMGCGEEWKVPFYQQPVVGLPADHYDPKESRFFDLDDSYLTIIHGDITF